MVYDEILISYPLFRDSQSVQAYLGSSTASIYGMESMIYFTAGLLDEFDGPDVTLEAAITKVKQILLNII